MADDIRLSTNFWRHPKTVKLIRKGGLDAVRSLQILWCFCAQERTDGLLHGMDADDIEIAADWQGEPGKFVELLLSGGWMECSPGCSGEGTYALHGWLEHNPPIRERRLDIPDSAWKSLRKIVFERDKYVCQYCGRQIDDPDCDHVIPLVRGGRSVMSNLLTACPSCNRSKGARTVEEWLNEY